MVENYAERYPLKHGNVKPESAIETLEKMFNVFAFIEEYKSVYDDKSKRSKVRDDAIKLGEMTNVARTKKEYNANEKGIEHLITELQKLMDREDAELSQEETDNLDKASEIKGQLTSKEADMKLERAFEPLLSRSLIKLYERVSLFPVL